MKLRTITLIFVATIVLSTHATYRGYLQKLITIPLPYYPGIFKFKTSDSDVQLNRSPNSASFYFSSSKDGEKNNSFSYGFIENNPARGRLNVQEPKGIALESAVINKESDNENPFFDSAIVHFSTYWNYPVLVTEKNPNVVCYMESLMTHTYQNLLVTEPLKDTQGDISQGIMGLALGSTGTIEYDASPYVFAAVKDSNGLWGEHSACGIAVIKYDKKEEEILTKNAEGKEKTEKKIDHFFNVLDATTGLSFGNKAVALDPSVISINGGNYSIKPDVVDLYWNPYLERLYVALQVKNSMDCSQEQGSRALLVGRIDSQQRLVFDPMIPDHLCQGDDKIIGACGPGAATSLHKVRTLCTSTGYNYLILVGGVGQPEQTDKLVYALPLTDKILDLTRARNRSEIMENADHGIIASKKSASFPIPSQTHYGYKITSRTVPYQATSSQELLTKNDKETQVGAGRELPSKITDVIIEGDVIYVACAQSGNGQHPGIFHSQAILDEAGKIAAWTPWQRIAGIQEGVNKAYINLEQYFIAYLKSDKAEVVGQITQNIPPNKEIIEAEKVKGDLTDLIDEQFDRAQGGVHGLFDFSTTNPLCGKGNLVSCMVATGYKKIVLVETGNLNDEAIFTAFKDGFNINISHNGNGSIAPVTDLNDLTKPNILVVEGGVLDEIGAITEAVVVSDGSQAWLVVSGMRGIAILSAEDGRGIECQSGILPHFAGIQKQLTFKKLGNWNTIKKIIGDGEFLYILTKNKLERLVVNQQVVQDNSLQKGITLAEIMQQDGSFFDVGVSGPLGLLATSKGLLVNAAGTDCRSDDSNSMHWKQILLPHAKGAAYKLFFVSTAGNTNGFGHCGQVYVSTGSALENITRVFRLYIKDVFASGVTDDSVQVVDDTLYLNKGKLPLLTFPNFRDHFATDGAHYFSARSRHVKQKPFMHVVSLPHIKETKVLEPNSFQIPINIGKKTNNVSALVQNSATGNWLLAGDFGVRIHN